MLKLFKSFQFSHHSILGIDIGSTSVKAIELVSKENNHFIEGYGIEPLPPNAVDGHTIKDVDAVANCIKHLVLRTQLKSKCAVLAVPDSAVISKVLQVNDFLNEAEIGEFIVMEADKYIPYPIEEISIDFEILGHSSKNPSMLDVLIVASRSDNVSSRVEASTKAGLKVQVVDVESFAIERTVQLLIKDLPDHVQSKIIAVIDIDDEFTNLFVLDNMKIIYTREDDFGSKQLISSIASYYGITEIEAILMKEQNKLPSDYDEAILVPFVETLCVHVKRSLQFFFSTSRYGTVDHILLAGGIVKLPNLITLFQEREKTPTTIANPMNHLNLPQKLNTSAAFDDSPSLLVACGLALRNLG